MMMLRRPCIRQSLDIAAERTRGVTWLRRNLTTTTRGIESKRQRFHSFGKKNNARLVVTNGYYSSPRNSSSHFPLRYFSSSSDKEEEENLEFQAETRQLLDIVTHSLYTDREVFLRELVSNASDALEKKRLLQQQGGNVKLELDELEEEPAIWIETNEEEKSISIIDNGIGMNKDEMIQNLGTIARSGSKAFLKELVSDDQKDEKGIIGKFGVGFYSAFMVGDRVHVQSKSAIRQDGESTTTLPHLWKSDGSGTFQVTPVQPMSNIEQQQEEEKVEKEEEKEETKDEDKKDEELSFKKSSIGSSIKIFLKSDQEEFCKEARIRDILKKYSNFVNFAIHLNGKRVNTMQAIWAQDPKTVSKETHEEFFRFLSNSYEPPMETLHFRADAPLDIQALLYIPPHNAERFGMERLKPTVSLYSRKVLIESASPDIVPDWMRFVEGVVDSEDLPLSVSREKAQDSRLVSKLRNVLVRKLITHLKNWAKKDEDRFKKEFYSEYAFFLKEGICQDYEFQESLAKLLYYPTNKSKELTSLDEYISRCPPEQKKIYYLISPSRESALSSPYMEAFPNTEVLFLKGAIDDFVVSNLHQYEGRTFVSIESGNIEKDKDDEKKDDDDKKDVAQMDELCSWLKLTWGKDRASSVKTTTRLVSSPAVVVNDISSAQRRFMNALETGNDTDLSLPTLPPQKVEINPRHEIILGLERLYREQPELAERVAHQVLDNCLIAAGLMDDGRIMLPRINELLQHIVGNGTTMNNKNDDSTIVSEEVMNEEEVVANESDSSSDSDDSSDEDEESDDDFDDDDSTGNKTVGEMEEDELLDAEYKDIDEKENNKEEKDKSE